MNQSFSHYHTSNRRSTTQRPHRGPSLEDLARHTGLPVSWLSEQGLREGPGTGLLIPYFFSNGELVTARILTDLHEPMSIHWVDTSSYVVPYGLHRLATARQSGELLLVVGEMECWTLWYHAFPALGFADPKLVTTLDQEDLQGITRLYLVKPAGAAGEEFVSLAEQHLAGLLWPGKVAVISLREGQSFQTLFHQEGSDFRRRVQEELAAAESLFLTVLPSRLDESAPRLFTLSSLLSQTLPPARWAVPNLVPEGVILLAGKPKQGKSWLALSVALAIAAGEPALGAIPVTQGEVLYLALEDTERRLQARAKHLLSGTSAVPGGIAFAVAWPRLDQGGLEYLDTYLTIHPETRLVIVDTWARISPRSQSRARPQYELEYDALAPLKTLVEAHHVSLLLVHHLRKMGAADILDEITGSTGLVGAVDGVLILKRERGQHEGTLFVTGRDIEQEQTLALRFEPDQARWVLMGSAEQCKRSRERQEILDLLLEQGADGLTARQVSETLRKKYHTVRTLLRKMEEAGDLARLGTGYVAVPR